MEGKQFWGVKLTGKLSKHVWQQCRTQPCVHTCIQGGYIPRCGWMWVCRFWRQNGGHASCRFKHGVGHSYDYGCGCGYSYAHNNGTTTTVTLMRRCRGHQPRSCLSRLFDESIRKGISGQSWTPPTIQLEGSNPFRDSWH